MKSCVVVQGPSNHVSEIKNSFNNHDIIFSTWVGSEHLYSETDNVIFNTQPESNICSNFLFQQKSTIAGLRFAKERGYTHVLKMRSDIINVGHDIFDIFETDKMNFLCWHYHEVYPTCPGYLVDYFMYGDVDDLIKLWDIDEIFCNVPEILITDSYIRKINKIPNFILYELTNESDLFWIKNNIFLSSYKTTLYNDIYRKFDFGDTIRHLDTNYLNFLHRGI